MNRIPHNFNDDSEDRDSSLQQSSTGAQKNQYNLNAVQGKFGKFDNFFKTDIHLSEDINKKKEEPKEENNEKKSEKGDRFMNDLFDEIGDSGLNNNSSKASQKDSKVKNKSTNKSVNKNIKKNSIDNEFEDLDENIDENEENENIKNENEEKKDEPIKTEMEKKNMMENYLNKHPPKIDKNQIKEENISEQSNEIEENINTNDNLQKNNSRLKEEDDDYGGFDNINSETINNQNVQTTQSKKNKKNSTSSNINKQIVSSDSYNKYMDEFAQSKINEINRIEDSNKNNVESLINEVNNEHKKNAKKLENNNFNIYSNNNLNNVINSNNFINSVGSGDSVNVKNIIKNEINKYDSNKPGFKKEEYNNKNLDYQINLSDDIKKFFNLKKVKEKNFTIYKPFKKKENLLLNLKKESSLDYERNLRMTKENELKKLQEAYDSLIEEIDKMKIQKQKDLKELKDDYDNSLKNIENNKLKREKQKFDDSLREIENKYQTDISKKASEIERLKNECEYWEYKYKNLENEYNKLKDSRENEEQLNNLKSENYRLYAQINDYKNKKNKDLELMKKNKNENDNKNKSDTMKVFENLLNEREINTQEKLLNNYLKEIKSLNEEIIRLKSTNLYQKNKNIDSLNQNINISSDKGRLNGPKMNNYVINPSLQESAEKQIKKLQNFLLPSSDDPTNNKLMLMEKEFSRLQSKESPNEITFTNFITVMKQFKVPLTSNELIEIFNNFPRIKNDRIRMNDFINALNSKSPSAFFLQSDPSYLNELESKLIEGQNKIKELQKFIIVNNNENEEFKLQLKKAMEENKLLKNKINELNSQILQYFLFREEKNMSNPDVIQMKEKMRTMEIKSKSMDSELSEKFGKYEKRIESLQKTYEDERNNLMKEKDGFKEQINKLKNEKEKEKNEFDKREIVLKAEISQLNEKLQKYKKNYNILSNKNEMNKKEKEKILNSFKDKGLDPEQILAYVNNRADIQEILGKVNELERKNLNREEIYKRICIETNQTQLNKELEKIKKKHEEEKRGLLKIIAQKNNELNSIKSEFFGIMNELEKLKANNKFK